MQIYQTQVRYADGTNHDVEFRKAVFNDPKTSEPMEMIGVILDLTELRWSHIVGQVGSVVKVYSAV